MAENLTKKQEGFAKDYLETGNGTQAALNNYDTEDENSAAAMASKLLRKDKIRAYLEEKSETAASMIFQLATSAENESVRLNASKDILDRGGFKPVERSESKVLNVNINPSDPASIELAKKYEEELRDRL